LKFFSVMLLAPVVMSPPLMLRPGDDDERVAMFPSIVNPVSPDPNVDRHRRVDWRLRRPWLTAR
jgi:hypothetical protein